MKLYGDFSREDWLRVSGLTEEEIPEVIILHGEDTPYIFEKLDEWESFLSSSKKVGWNVRVGKLGKTNIAYASVYWASMAANVAHIFCSLGTKRVIQTGYCGGLSAKFSYGKIYIATSSIGEDGVSRHYSPNFQCLESSTALVNSAEDKCLSKGWEYEKGPIVTTAVMLLEDEKMVTPWIDKGYIGVDGETAATFAVAETFGAEAIALLNCSDHLPASHSLFDDDESREELEEKIDERIKELAIHLARPDSAHIQL